MGSRTISGMGAMDDAGTTPAERLSWALDRAKDGGTSHAEVARQSGTDPAHIRRMRDGRNPISADKAEALGRVLGVPPWWLMCWEGPEDAPAPEISVSPDVRRYGEWMRGQPEHVRELLILLGETLAVPSAQRKLKDLLAHRALGTAQTEDNAHKPKAKAKPAQRHGRRLGTKS